VSEAVWPYLLLAGWSFLSATLLPLSSELALAAQIKAGFGSVSGLVAAATIGNVGGSILNWWLGTVLRQFEGRRWFPVSPEQIQKASARFQRYGAGVLLLSWLPIIGDPLTVVAGVLRVPLAVFLPLVILGKAARYVAVAWFAA
jgi:membrane protein YqaA with SNARE-associated domain